MNYNNGWAFFAATILFLVVCFVSQYFYEEYLWFKSVESWIPGMQSNTWWPWKRFVQFLTWWGWELLWTTLLAFSAAYNRVSALYAFQNFTFFIWILVLFRMYYSDPAPYMDREYIDTYECDQNTFQNPSLEVALACYGYSMLFYLAYDWRDIERPRTRLTQASGDREGQALFEDQEPEWFLSDNSPWAKRRADDISFWIWLTLVIYLNFLIAYAAMYSGRNSFDQVLFGMMIGYGFMCIFYYVLKDEWTRDLTKTSEHRETRWRIASWYVQHTIVIIVCIGSAKLLYHYQKKDYTINPRWKSNHRDDCGLLPYPSFFDKEMLMVYRFMYLNLGVVLGYGFDSLVLGGTRIDFNQLRSSEGKNPVLGFIIRFVLMGGWILLNVWGFQSLMNMVVHKWLFLQAIPYFTAGFPLLSFMKYPFKLLGATRDEIYAPNDMGAVQLRQAERPGSH